MLSRSLLRTSLVNVALSLPLFFSFFPFAFIYKFPGEVIPYSVLLAPILFCSCKLWKTITNGNIISALFVISLPLVFFAIIAPGNIGLLIKNLALLNPFFYFLSFLAVLIGLKNNPQYLHPSTILFYAICIMFATVLLGHIFPPALELMRSLFVNALGSRTIAGMLAYSGSSGLFSEPSYQALMSVSILSSCLVSRISRPNLVVIILLLLTILLTKSLTGIAFAIGLILLRVSLQLLNAIVAFYPRLRLNIKFIYAAPLVLISIYLFTLFSKSYLRLSLLITLLSEIDPFKLGNSFLSIENQFGSHRIFGQYSSCHTTVVEMLFSNTPLTDDSWFYCVRGFSSFQQLQFSLGIFAALLILTYVLYALIKYTSSREFIRQQGITILGLSLPVLFTIFNILLLGPVASPFIYMPLLAPFGNPDFTVHYRWPFSFRF